MILKFLVCLFFSSSFLYARAPSTFRLLENDLMDYPRSEMVGNLSQFVQTSLPSRMIGLPGHEKAKEFLVSIIKKYDPKGSGVLKVSNIAPNTEEIKAFYQNDFDQKIAGKFPNGSPEYTRWKRFTDSMKAFAEKKKTVNVQNIDWEKKGLNSKKVLVVTAHYDTISHHKENLTVNETEKMPGANYNASGVVVALGLIKTLAKIDLNYTVKVVFLDYQGLGFHGATVLADELTASGNEVMGIVNLEMLGQDTSYLDSTKQLGNMSLYTRENSLEKKFAGALVEKGSQLTKKVNFEIRPNGFESSDNFRFWEKGFLSVTFSQNWEEDFNPKFYQNPQDTPETLNHDTLYASYQYLGGAVIGTLLDLTK